MIAARDPNLNVSGQRAVAYVGVRPARRGTLTLTAGLHHLRAQDNAWANSDDPAPAPPARGSQRFVFAADFSDQVPEVWEYTLLTAADYLYADWASPAAGAQALGATKLFARGEIKTLCRLHVRSSAQWVKLDDHNESREGDQGFMVEAIRGRLSSMFGAGAWFLSYREATGAYWAPRQFSKYELRGENILRLARDLSANLNLNVGRGGELDRAYDWSGFLEARLSWRWRHSTELNLGWTQMKSWSAYGTWERNDLNVSLSAAL